MSQQATKRQHEVTEVGNVTPNQAWQRCGNCGKMQYIDLAPTADHTPYGPMTYERCERIQAANFSYLCNPTTGLMTRNIRHPYRWILRHRKDVRHAKIIYDPDALYPVRAEVVVDDYTMLWFSFGTFDLCKRMLKRLVFPTMVEDRSGDDQSLIYCLVP